MRAVKSYSVPCPYCGVLAGQPCRKGLWQMQRAHAMTTYYSRSIASAGTRPSLTTSMDAGSISALTLVHTCAAILACCLLQRGRDARRQVSTQDRSPDTPFLRSGRSAVKREYRIVYYHQPRTEWRQRLRDEREKRNNGRPLWQGVWP